MLSSITPVGEVSRSQRWAVTITAFTIGSALGGAGLGLSAGVVGAWWNPSARTGLAVVALGAAAAAISDLVAWTPPSLRRQVDRTWMTRFRGWVYGVGYGLQLGCALVTYISSWATWLMVVAMVVVADIRWAVAMGTLHGLGRAASLWTTMGLDTPDAIRRHHRRLQGWYPSARAASIALLAAASLTSVVVLA